MKLLELFCGKKSIASKFRASGHEVFTVDNNKIFVPDLLCDIEYMSVKSIIDRFGKPDIIWASPPWQAFSVLTIRHHWKNKCPVTWKSKKAIRLVLRTLKLIHELKPRFWFIENPVGMMRTLPEMKNLHRFTVTYCRYGFEYMKPTDIFTNCTTWSPRYPCIRGDGCHVAVLRGDRDSGVHGSQRFVRSILDT